MWRKDKDYDKKNYGDSYTEDKGNEVSSENYGDSYTEDKGNEVSSENYGDSYTKETKKVFIRGIVIGVMLTLIGCQIGTMVAVNYLEKKGTLHFSKDGSVYVQSDETSDDTGIGSEVAGKLNAIDSVLSDFYFGELDEETAKDNIYKAYMNSFGDKYTQYYTAEEYKKLNESSKAIFGGIGAYCSKNDDGTIGITNVTADSPAEKAGLKQGDSIVKVGETDIREMDLTSAVNLIKGDIGTEVTLTIRRDGSEFQCTLTRAAIDEITVKYAMTEDYIGYVYISEFGSGTATQYKNAIEDLQSQGMKALIVDIRNNPGGILTTVCSMLEYTLPDGLLVYTETKNGEKKEYVGDDDNEITVPMAVIVNGNSASASEVYTGALQDYGKARIIGTKTYGKGIVQTIRTLTDGSAIKFTIAKYYTPNGRDIHGEGITPDEVVDLPSDATEDLQYEAALEYLRGQIK